MTLSKYKISHWLKSVSTYANSEGGALYYGVDNDGNVTVLANPQSDSDFISQKINAHLDPVPDRTLTPGEDEQGHKVLEVLVKPGQLTPYYLVLEDGTLTNGGLLFSDNCEVYQSRVFRTRWNGLTKTDAINDAEYSGNLLYLLKTMRGFIKSNAAKRWFKLPDYRLNFPEYAERAILECCVNT